MKRPATIKNFFGTKVGDSSRNDKLSKLITSDADSKTNLKDSLVKTENTKVESLKNEETIFKTKSAQIENLNIEKKPTLNIAEPAKKEPTLNIAKVENSGTQSPLIGTTDDSQMDSDGKFFFNRNKMLKKFDKSKLCNPIDYDPSVDTYDPIKNGCWSPNQKTPFLAFCSCLKKIEETSSSLKMVNIAANFFRSLILLSPKDLIPTLYLFLNEVAAPHKSIKLGIGDSALITAIANTTGRRKDQVKASYSELGDLGLVAESSRVKQSLLIKPKPLVLEYVYSSLMDIALLSGEKSSNHKNMKIQSMMTACLGCESRYLIRLLAHKLRIGFGESLILNALAQAIVLLDRSVSFDNLSESDQLDIKQACQDLRNAYYLRPDFDELIPILLEHGVRNLSDKISMKPSIPVKPMLAIPISGISDLMKRCRDQQVVIEYKYDGERAQIHFDQQLDSLYVYSRNQENQTPKYPELQNLNQQVLKNPSQVTSYIIDSEIVAYDKESQRIQPFQVLLTRKHKNVTLESIKVHICIVAFDILYLNGESLEDRTILERREILMNTFNSVDNFFLFSNSSPAHFLSEDTIGAYIDEAVHNHCEGLMVKFSDSLYEINKRSTSWIKVKKDYIDKVGDTIDVVVMGGYFGTGKRKGFYGGFLIGCYDVASDEIQSICKIGSGFTDENIAGFYGFFKDHVIQRPHSFYKYSDTLEPDHWFDNVQVWEVKAADMSLSTVHFAGRNLIEKDKGVSLRFPRFVKIRDDKKFSDATSSEQIVFLYNNQSIIKEKTSVSKSASEEEDDE